MELPQDYTKLNQQQRRVVRNEYRMRQDGKCAHCGAALDDDPAPHVKSKHLDLRRFPPHFLANPVHLHHSHKTGMTIGAVHAHCNGVLWQYHGE